ncbi:hypothetical protein C8R44DRAFT_873470 [Mycena epipterygia]|nr:hypothetical protein C8R44DRAFT_873470 [Mycena epipterygia]
MPTPPVVTFIFGGWDLGICADLILQGVVFAQFAHYVALCSKDPLALRAFVVVLLILTTLKSAQGIVILRLQNVTHFADIEAAASLFTNSWTSETNLMFGAIIAFYVQLFFCKRLWGISRNIYVVAIVLALFVFALLASIVTTAFTSSGDSTRTSRWIGIHLGTVSAGDAALCGSTVYFLLAHSKHVLPETGAMLNAIAKLTFQSAAPGALCALLNLIGSQVSQRTANEGDAGANRWTMLALITNFALPKLYAISALWTLNSRKKIQSAYSSGQNTSSTGSKSGCCGRTNNVELALSLSGNRNVVPIQVRTQVQTTQHADDTFSPKPKN